MTSKIFATEPYKDQLEWKPQAEQLQNTFYSKDIISKGDDSLQEEQIEHARKFQEIMDSYSLHYFIIRKGKALE